MPNPRAQQQLAQVSTNPLDRAVQSFKSIKEPAQALGDMLAATLRGSTAATLGAGGDIRELVDLLGPEKVEALLGKRVLPTTEEMKGMLPKATSYEHPYETIGEFLPLPGTGAALKAAGYGAGRGAGALTRATGQAISDAMIHQAGPLAQGPLSALAPRMAMTNVVKPKGGNWLTGSVEKSVNTLKRNDKAAENLEEMRRVYPPDALAAMSDETRATVDRAFPHLEQESALNKWIDSNLSGYMKNQMGTPEDPVRALFEKRTQDIEAKYAKSMEKVQRLEQRAQNESDPRKVANLLRESKQLAEDSASERDLLKQHITHFPANEIEFANAWIPEALGVKRMKGGYPVQGMGESPAAKAWETMSDQAIYGGSAEGYRQPLTPSEVRRGYSSVLDENPWIAKLDPETMVYHPEGTPQDLGIDHIVDVLRQDVAAGRIRPEQLNKVSMEQAVQRAAEYDLEMARKMKEAVIQQQEGFPVHKEYPEGYKWIELAPSKEKKVYTAENLPKGFELEKDRDGYYQVRNFNEGMTPTTNSFSRSPEESIKKFNDWVKEKNHDLELQSALTYEGKTMGHCVGGYCPDVIAGKKRIFSLRDKKGEPHVTIETRPPNIETFLENMSPYDRYQIGKEVREKHYGASVPSEKQQEYEALFDQALKDKYGEIQPTIYQIKGKGNKKPKEDYIPFVQDFVRSGDWGDIGDFHNTDLIDMKKSAIPWSENIQPEQIDQLVGGMEGGTSTPKYGVDELRDKALNQIKSRYVTQQEFDDFLLNELTPPEGMAAGGTPRPPTEQERETLRKLRESFVPAATEAERLKKVQDNLDKMNRKVSLSDNPDQMWMEVQDQKLAGGGLTKLAKLARAPAKTKAEIEAIAERMAPQVMGEYVRGKEGAKTVAGKTQKQFAREKELQHDIRPTSAERPLPKEVNIEDLKNQVMMGISGDPTITGQTVHAVGGRELRSPSPQHGGPLYGLGHDKEHFWASNLGAANNVQNRAREIAQQYDAPVLGNYVMMGPDSYSYAQHFADANLQNIRPEEMTKAQIEGFNKLIRQGSLKSGPRPTWPGIENPEEAYLHMAIDPELRKHFGNLMQMPTVTQQFGLPSGLDVAHAVTEPSLRDLEIGVTGKSMGLMRPDVRDLKLSEHPTYSHDIPGEFMGGMKFPVPYELSFPDSLKAVRENPKQAPQEFGSFKMAGPRQVIDQQLIDEIKAYEERMKQLTGKAAGGEISADDVILEERPL